MQHCCGCNVIVYANVAPVCRMRCCCAFKQHPLLSFAPLVSKELQQALRDERTATL